MNHEPLIDGLLIQKGLSPREKESALCVESAIAPAAEMSAAGRSRNSGLVLRNHLGVAVAQQVGLRRVGFTLNGVELNVIQKRCDEGEKQKRQAENQNQPNPYQGKQRT